MEFTGEIYYNFESIDVWRVYSTLVRAASAGNVNVAVEWREFPGPDLRSDEPPTGKMRLLAACAVVAKTAPQSHERFVQALLTLVYEQKDDPDKETTFLVAARVAGLDGSALSAEVDSSGLALLVAARSHAEERGILAVPTIVRHGPPLHIKTTEAAKQGSAVARIELLNRMLDDDGVWALTKP
ncbi:MAG: hypothetical protein QNL12_06085 [Acidimicrobiia bacterium]|nr:hypothetical protein [Acidimicrobiia bacterium]MDX2466864.1 hypothetical protein [Acidimicrobiia bacterium]